MKRRRIMAALIIIVICVTLFGCGAAPPEPVDTAAPGGDEESTLDLFAMDTFMELHAYGPSGETAIQDASAEIQRLEHIFSATDPASEVHEINQSQGMPVAVSEDLIQVLEQVTELSRQTERSVDVTIFPVLRAWGFTTGTYQIPEEREIQELLEYVDDSLIRLDPGAGTVTLPAGAEIDLGAVAKGYAGDVCASRMKEYGVTSALLNLGGSTIRTLGTKPDGSLWRIAVQDPRDSSAYAGVVEIGEGAVDTSGGYERYFEQDGQVYWHILDPHTGYPAKSGLISVTVLTDQACYGDGLSTALFVMGLERTLDFWRARGDFEFILIDEQERLYVSEGAAMSFTPMGNYENTELTVISREE